MPQGPCKLENFLSGYENRPGPQNITKLYRKYFYLQILFCALVVSCIFSACSRNHPTEYEDFSKLIITDVMGGKNEEYKFKYLYFGASDLSLIDYMADTTESAKYKFISYLGSHKDLINKNHARLKVAVETHEGIADTIYLSCYIDKSGKLYLPYIRHLLLKARKEFEKREYSKQSLYLKAALPIDPFSEVALGHLAFTQVTRLSDVQEEGYKNAFRLLELNPKSGSALNTIAGYFSNQGKPNIAIAYYMRSIEVADTNEDVSSGYANIGLCYSKKHNCDSSIFYFQKAISIKKRRSYYARLAQEALDCNKRELAFEITAQGLLAEPEQESLIRDNLNFARVLVEKKDIATARRLLLDILIIDPNNTNVKDLLNKIE